METSFELIDGSVLLRPPRMDDAPSIAAAVRESLFELQPWMDWATEAFDEAAARRWVQSVVPAWEHATAFHFVIVDAISGGYLGNCAIDGVDRKERRGNLSYWVRSSRTRRGIASRAARLAARFAFESIKLERLEIVIAADNLASRRAAHKTGARFEGPFKKPLVVHTDVYDAVVYVLAPADLDLLPG